MPWDSEELAREIERLHRRWHFLAGDGTGAVPSVWQVAREALQWHVVLGEVIEADIDIEVMEEVLVVRGLEGGTLRVCVLPVPSPWRAASARMLFREGVLEIVIEAPRG